ncbi:hypothetical protein DV736_g2957, partial [Chaetothyriales sp. CBS 134916]
MPEANVPQYTIDLSLPPRKRYKALATRYTTQMQALTPLFDSLLADLGIAERHHASVHRFAAIFLRGVHSKVETAELRGISSVTGIPMYLLICFNVVLDILMGCTSGAVRSAAAKDASPAPMLHFRTLDWGMDPLRAIVVQLNFVRSQSEQPDTVLARSITYAGFVGVLTGVRSGLSLSLNFRPVHNATTRMQQFRFYMHHLLVLLGYRQSISSILRSYLLPESSVVSAELLDRILQELPARHTTAAYLIYCDGNTAVTMEKDFNTAVVTQSSSFIATTNHDSAETSAPIKLPTPATQYGVNLAKAVGVDEMLDESKERLDCICQKWQAYVHKPRRSRWDVQPGQDMTQTVFSVPARELIKWVTAWPTTNETTHYAAVLDPAGGEVLWAHAYAEPVQGSA